MTRDDERRRAVAGKIAEIEDEMRRAGLWQDAPLDAGQYEFRAAFASDTMAFAQWLQFVFVPRVREVLSSGGDFPAKSEVSRQAFREFVMYPAYEEGRTEKLLRLLQEFDRLF